MSNQQTVRVPAFQVLTATADANSAGSVVLINDTGLPGTPVSVAPSSSATIAAAVYDRTFRLDSLTGMLAFVLSYGTLGGAGAPLTADAINALYASADFIGRRIKVPIGAIADLATDGMDLADGSLPDGTYYLVLVPLDADGNEGLPSNEVVVTATSGGAGDFLLSGTLPSGAIDFRIYYGSTPGGEDHYVPSFGYVLPAAYFYDLSEAVAGTPPTVNSAVIQVSELVMDWAARSLSQLLQRVRVEDDALSLNTAYGFDANPTNYGLENTAVGAQAMRAAGSGSGIKNTALGRSALLTNTDGHHNTALGHSALVFNTTGYENNAHGYIALFSNTTGYGNVADGLEAMKDNTSGFYNVAVGREAFRTNTTGSYNVAIGASSGTDILNGTDFAGNASVIDTNMVFIGAFATRHTSDAGADLALTNGIAIGYAAQVPRSNCAVIGNADVLDVLCGSAAANASIWAKRVFIVGTTPPADADLLANQAAVWFDPTNAAAKLMVKAKQADGTVKTGSFNVQT